MPRVRPALLTLLMVLSLAVAGCGGNSLEAEEVSVEPPVLTIPKEDTAEAPEETAEPDADEDATPTPTATAESGAAGGTTTTPSAGGSTGAAAPSGGDTTTTETQPADPDATGGAQADQDFETFCAENPGACPQQ